MLSLGTEVPGT